MPLFEVTLILLGASVALLHIARQFRLPYPAILALAGCAVAALPFAPEVGIEPHLALALFVAPAVLDSAYDLPPRELKRNWLPLISLALLLVDFTSFCPIRQQLMSNFSSAVRFRPFPGHRSNVNDDIPVANDLDAVPTTDGLPGWLEQAVLPVAPAG